MHRNADRHDVVRVVTEGNAHHAHEALDGCACGRHQPVSYTHLDVYKRQPVQQADQNQLIEQIMFEP